MYTVAVQREFIARHRLIGGDWGPENELHAHHYVVEARFYGKQLDRRGFLIDICEVEAHLDRLIDYYRESILNDLSEFNGLNPSLENFARIFYRALKKMMAAAPPVGMSIKIWENKAAWAEYREEVGCTSG